jgi:hypothetical protein
MHDKSNTDLITRELKYCFSQNGQIHDFIPVTITQTKKENKIISNRRHQQLGSGLNKTSERN